MMEEEAPIDPSTPETGDQSRSRPGWDQAFQKMARLGDDALLDGDDIATTWDTEEWEWE